MAQTRIIRRLAARLRTTYKKHRSWHYTAQLHCVLTPDGEPNKGLAFRIARERYMPSWDVVARLIRDGAIKLPRPKPLDLSPAQRRAFANALCKRKPLPPPSKKTLKAFDEWRRLQGFTS